MFDVLQQIVHPATLVLQLFVVVHTLLAVTPLAAARPSGGGDQAALQSTVFFSSLTQTTGKLRYSNRSLPLVLVLLAAALTSHFSKLADPACHDRAAVEWVNIPAIICESHPVPIGVDENISPLRVFALVRSVAVGDR